MDILAASAGMQSIALGVQASAMMMKSAMIEMEQNAQAVLDAAPNTSPSVNPPHLGKNVDTSA